MYLIFIQLPQSHKILLYKIFKIIKTLKFQNLQIGASLHRPASPGQHDALQLQGAGPPVLAAGHGRHHVRLPGLCVREGGREHDVCNHAGRILVGHHHYDNGMFLF